MSTIWNSQRSRVIALGLSITRVWIVNYYIFGDIIYADLHRVAMAPVCVDSGEL